MLGNLDVAAGQALLGGGTEVQPCRQERESGAGRSAQGSVWPGQGV